MKYACRGLKGLCGYISDKPLIECPKCGCTRFRIVGSASENPDNEEYEDLKDRGLWG